MNSSIDTTSQTIGAREVPDDERLQMLPRHFGRHMLTVEYAVYAFMRKLSSQYTGGYWNYLELSNGGFYMAPAHDTPFNVLCRDKWLRRPMSADAAGITACLFALSQLSFQIQHESIARHFHQLRDFALEHAEASVILGAIRLTLSRFPARARRRRSGLSCSRAETPPVMVVTGRPMAVARALTSNLPRNSASSRSRRSSKVAVSWYAAQ